MLFETVLKTSSEPPLLSTLSQTRFKALRGCPTDEPASRWLTPTGDDVAHTIGEGSGGAVDKVSSARLDDDVHPVSSTAATSVSELTLVVIGLRTLLHPHVEPSLDALSRAAEIRRRRLAQGYAYESAYSSGLLLRL